jgi:pimeloyl-ACP methyl ester carboxylesterase
MSITSATATAPGRHRTRRRLLIALVAVALLCLLAMGGFVVWAGATPPPMPEALAALESDERVTVATAPWLSFRPAGSAPTAGLVFYPGGKVDPRSYAPAARALAEQGYLVVVPSMPLNLAVLAPGKAAEVMAAHPEIQHWVVGGHSLGGAMAAQYLADSPGAADGLLLWGAYAPRGADLASSGLAVTSVTGTLDGLTKPADVAAGKPLLPPDATYVAIAGGNHAQFGWYGPQDGDNPATISREEQQRQAVAASAALLERVSR